MQPLAAFSLADRRPICGVLTDIDDTLTTEGRLTAEAYGALERLRDAGFLVLPITGRPAGWCDHIARMWPVDAVVGENGAFYFRYDEAARKLVKRFLASDTERAGNRKRLEAVRDTILAAVPGAALASDQLYREADLAVDFCEDVAPLPRAEVDRIVALFETAGATASCCANASASTWTLPATHSSSPAIRRTTRRCSASFPMRSASPTCATSRTG